MKVEKVMINGKGYYRFRECENIWDRCARCCFSKGCRCDLPFTCEAKSYYVRPDDCHVRIGNATINLDLPAPPEVGDALKVKEGDAAAQQRPAERGGTKERWTIRTDGRIETKQTDMAKEKTARDYERELKKMIKGRTGKECEAWLLPQISLTASNMVMIKRIENAISEADLTTIVSGSMGQAKTEINPLIPYYDKLQRTLLAQLEALGLNYNVTPKKVTENTKQGGKEQDVLKQTLDIAMEGTRNEGDLY